MARPDQSDQRRRELLPVVAQAFAERGYRRTTTAELARRCGVRENILYRLWKNKKQMFIASIEYVFELSSETWAELLAEDGSDTSPAERLLDYESRHHGESGLQRIIFAGLSEVDDPEIREALRKMYGRFHRFIRGQIVAHRDGGPARGLPDETVTAWAIVGLGNVANISRELGLLSGRGRKRMFAEAGRLLLEGRRG